MFSFAPLACTQHTFPRDNYQGGLLQRYPERMDCSIALSSLRADCSPGTLGKELSGVYWASIPSNTELRPFLTC